MISWVIHYDHYIGIGIMPRPSVFVILFSHVSACMFDFVFPPYLFLRCTAHTDSLSDEWSSQEGARSVPWSSLVHSSPLAIASGKALFAVPLPDSVRSSLAYGGAGFQGSQSIQLWLSAWGKAVCYGKSMMGFPHPHYLHHWCGEPFPFSPSLHNPPICQVVVSHRPESIWYCSCYQSGSLWSVPVWPTIATPYSGQLASSAIAVEPPPVCFTSPERDPSLSALKGLLSFQDLHRRVPLFLSGPL